MTTVWSVPFYCVYVTAVYLGLGEFVLSDLMEQPGVIPILAASLILVAGAKFERRGPQGRIGAILWGVVGVTVLSMALYHAAMNDANSLFVLMGSLGMAGFVLGLCRRCVKWKRGEIFGYDECVTNW